MFIVQASPPTIFLNYFSFCKLFFSSGQYSGLDNSRSPPWQLQISLFPTRRHLLKRISEMMGVLIRCSLPPATYFECSDLNTIKSSPPSHTTLTVFGHLLYYTPQNCPLRMQERCTLSNMFGGNQLTLSAFCHYR